jgi:hypothetical protein
MHKRPANVGHPAPAGTRETLHCGAFRGRAAYP